MLPALGPRRIRVGVCQSTTKGAPTSPAPPASADTRLAPVVVCAFRYIDISELRALAKQITPKASARGHLGAQAPWQDAASQPKQQLPLSPRR